MQFSVGTSWDASHLDVTGLTARLSEAARRARDLVAVPHFPGARGEPGCGRSSSPPSSSDTPTRARSPTRWRRRFIFSDDIALLAAPQRHAADGLGLSPAGTSRAFHRTRYAPGSASLVVAGDLSPQRARALAEEHFGDWTGPTPRLATAPVAPRERGIQIVVVDRPGSVQSELRVGHVGVARDTDDYFPLAVMNTILGGAFSSRLNLNLREKHGFTYGVSSAFVMRRLPGPFVVSTAVQTEVTAPALAEILREVRGIRDAPVAEGELRRRPQPPRRHLPAAAPDHRRRRRAPGGAGAVRPPLDYFDELPRADPRGHARRGAAGRRVAPQAGRPALVVVGDAEKIRESLEALGWRRSASSRPPGGA